MPQQSFTLTTESPTLVPATATAPQSCGSGANRRGPARPWASHEKADAPLAHVPHCHCRTPYFMPLTRGRLLAWQDIPSHLASRRLSGACSGQPAARPASAVRCISRPRDSEGSRGLEMRDSEVDDALVRDSGGALDWPRPWPMGCATAWRSEAS